MEPFFTTKGPGAGSGLGLSMIYGFARQSGGHLRIDSELGHGTKVRLFLPRAHGVEASTADDADELRRCRSGNESILLVDDNARCVRWRGVIWCRSATGSARPRTGRRHWRSCRPVTAIDLLFTDVVMPDGMTGYQLAAAARQLRPGLKVLFTTGYSGPGLTTSRHE